MYLIALPVTMAAPCGCLLIYRVGRSDRPLIHVTAIAWDAVFGTLYGNRGNSRVGDRWFHVTHIYLFL